MRLLEETSDRLVVHVAVGTRWLVPTDERGRRHGPLERAGWSLRPAVWERHEAIQVHYRDEFRSVWNLFRPDGDGVVERYVSFQLPATRTSYGIDSLDLELDVVASADFSTWRWKDVEAYRAARRSGAIDDGAARGVRTAAIRTLRELRRRAMPDLARWDGWRPGRLAPVEVDLEGMPWR
ncbi:MAG TPA: DUF402 domain-containing protein [Candidatus Dormibacteraeota bacterium]|nr:DUF402 domain-containing protein [Candidatus Dormibacteraeota bacterium]